MDDVFAIQDEITVAVVARLNIELVNNSVSVSDRPGSLEAYECYLRGRRLCEEWVPSGVTRARNMFRRAVQLEPGYARALAGVAICDSDLHEWNRLVT
jgi:adenylate cyclase